MIIIHVQMYVAITCHRHRVPLQWVCLLVWVVTSMYQHNELTLSKDKHLKIEKKLKLEDQDSGIE